MRAAADADLPVSIVRYPGDEPFNYQRAANLGAREAGDAHVLLLNDDVVPLAPEWLTRMVELLTLPGVGIVGAFLLYPDGRIQHAGVRIGEGPRHLYHEAPGDVRGHRFELLVPGNPQAVTGACMLVRREALDDLDGHDERFVHVFGDVDLCLRARQAAWRIAWCAGARLEHAESATYGRGYNEADVERFNEMWMSEWGRMASNRGVS
jgi:GT2 family glycosyltransferase